MKKTILVVDDNEDLRSTVALEVELLNHNSIEASDGQMAMEILLSRDIDLIISDIRMPNWDGQRLLSELRKHSKQKPPLIFMTGYSDLTCKFAYTQGADAILTKPFRPEDFSEIIDKFLQPIEERWKSSDVICSHKVSRQFESFSEVKNEFLLGRGGFFLASQSTDQNIAVESKVNFDINFETGPFKNISGTGYVKWHEGLPRNMGIEFISLSNDCRLTVTSYIKDNELMMYIPENGKNI